MDITPLVDAKSQVIRSYAPGQFTISGMVHKGAVMVFPDHVVKWNFSGGADQLTGADFEALKGAELDVLLIGCGAEGAFLPELRRALKETGINAETMDTGAACRTYNVLMAEGRRVAAALIPL
jgi:uncharacterized protein